jgi:hypothetical protein
MIENSDNVFHKADFLPQLQALAHYLPALENPDFRAGATGTGSSLPATPYLAPMPGS